LDAIDIKAGDEVLTSPYTFTATAEVIRYLGADPIFVDIDPLTFNISPVELERILKKTKQVKAIIPVHFAGQSCDMDAILNLTSSRKIKIVEDAAHSLPTTYNNKFIGTIGDLTVFSFYVTKTITTGEGGMVVTNDDHYASRISTMRLHGINSDVFDRYNSDKPKWYYEVVAPGFKYNMTDIAASIGLHQLKKINNFQERRQWIAAQYSNSFQNLPLRTPHVARVGDIHAWHLYVIQLELEKLSISRNRFIELMFEAGIGTSVHFIPLHLQPYWRDKYNLRPEDFPAAYDVYQRAVSLPIYPKMSDDDVGQVIETVQRLLIEYSK
jgi:dTDP-4-amino-4,6-dideoxygalactose transaminase